MRVVDCAGNELVLDGRALALVVNEVVDRVALTIDVEHVDATFVSAEEVLHVSGGSHRVQMLLFVRLKRVQQLGLSLFTQKSALGYAQSFALLQLVLGGLHFVDRLMHHLEKLDLSLVGH